MDPARAKALAAAERSYTPSQPCSRGHTSKRVTSNGACMRCTQIAARKARLKRPEEHREKLKRAKENTQRRQTLREGLEAYLRHFGAL
jgi:hypothetical protein